MRFPEDDLQMACARYLDYRVGVLWCHVANERKVSHQAGLRLKKKGVKKGVPDVLIFNRKGVYNGCAIELKIKGNYPTTEQKNWLESLKNQGWYIGIAYDFEQFYNMVEHYFNL